jgi:hypothetical protein
MTTMKMKMTMTMTMMTKEGKKEVKVKEDFRERIGVKIYSENVVDDILIYWEEPSPVSSNAKS